MKARDYFAVYESAEDVRSLNPDFALLGTLDEKVIVTAPGADCDFVSRFFAPTAGVPEDPVTGSAHCTLIPYWSRDWARLSCLRGRFPSAAANFFANSPAIACYIGGKAVLYSAGQIEIENASAQSRMKQ